MNLVDGVGGVDGETYENLKFSYNIDDLVSILALEKSVDSSLHQEVQNQIDGEYQSLAQLQKLTSSIDRLNQWILRDGNNIERVTELRDKLKERNQLRRSYLQRNNNLLHERQKDLPVMSQSTKHTKILGNDNSRLIQLCLKRIVNQLKEIYHIQKVDERRLMILNVCLQLPVPIVKGYLDIQLPHFNVALGHLASLLLHIASYLNVTLNHPIHLLGSKSTVHDQLEPILNSIDLEIPTSYPFYVERPGYFDQFLIAVKLFNLNLAQLGVILDLRFANLDMTVTNFWLILDKLG